MKSLALAIVAGAAVSAANADVLISEILGSTSGADWEFIEIVNTGAAPVDISGWTVELWDSDTGAQFGSSDAGSPYAVPGGTTLAPNAVFTFGNGGAQFGYPFTPDVSIADNSVENSSYTAILKDAGLSSVDSVFVTEGDAGDAANDNGSLITPNLTVGPDGTFLPAGFARTDVSGGFAILEFDNGDRVPFTLVGGTPGVNQIPAPAGLAALGLGLVAAGRRRR